MLIIKFCKSIKFLYDSENFFRSGISQILYQRHRFKLEKHSDKIYTFVLLNYFEYKPDVSVRKNHSFGRNFRKRICL